MPPEVSRRMKILHTSLGKVQQCREEHSSSDQEEKEGTEGIHTPLDRNNHDLDSHDDGG